MSHQHEGDPMKPCPGCFDDADDQAVEFEATQRKKSIAGWLLLVGLLVAAMYALSKHLG